MTGISKQEAVEAIKKLFGYEENKGIRDVVVSEKDGTTTFMINKQYKERFEVVEMLQDFFKDKFIDKGQCRIDNITFVYTMFHIEDRRDKS